MIPARTVPWSSYPIGTISIDITTTMSAVMTPVAGIARLEPVRVTWRDAIVTSTTAARMPAPESHHGKTPSPTMMCVTGHLREVGLL
jgi:hypothetical protein